MTEYYTTKHLPGVGISIGLTRLFYVLEEQGMLNETVNTAPADVLVIPMTDDLSPAVAAATALRDAGLRAQVYTEQKKFKVKLSYADKQKIPYVLLLGEDEITAGKVTLKDLATGEQETVVIGEAIGVIQRALAADSSTKPIREPEASK